MNLLMSLQLFSVLGGFLTGFWLPVRLIGYVPPMGLEILFDLIISCVSAVNLHLYFRSQHKSPREWRSWLNLGVIADAICLLPLSLIAFMVFDHSFGWILLLNLLCARHIGRIKEFLDNFDSLQPMTYRLIPILLSLPLLVHLVACGWISLGSGSAGLNDDKIFEYVKALYWAFTTLTTVGYGDIVAQTIPQMLYAGGTQVIGVAVFGYILSNVASIMGRSDAAREHHMDNLDKIETFIRTHRIPTETRAKVRAYYNYLWKHKKGYRDQSLLEGLPAKINAELFFHMNKNIVDKVPFLKGAEQDMLEDLMTCLQPRIFVPNERVFRAGEEGDALYLIQSGEVEILDGEGRVIVTLADGGFFGETALLSSKPRNATVRAKSYCDLYMLNRDAFARVMECYPTFKTHMEKVAAERAA